MRGERQRIRSNSFSLLDETVMKDGLFVSPGASNFFIDDTLFTEAVFKFTGFEARFLARGNVGFGAT